MATTRAVLEDTTELEHSIKDALLDRINVDKGETIGLSPGLRIESKSLDHDGSFFNVYYRVRTRHDPDCVGLKDFVQVRLNLRDLSDTNWADSLISQLQKSWKFKTTGDEFLVGEWKHRLNTSK